MKPHARKKITYSALETRNFKKPVLTGDFAKV